MIIDRESIERAFEQTVWFGFRELKPGCVQIRTPFTYPDGDVIDVFVIDTQDLLRVTDMGETLRHLGSCEARQHISGLQLLHRCVRLGKGELYQDVATPEEVPEAAIELVECIERLCSLV
ncbi:DUF1828 domain-containing protein [Alicyclobacillus mali]|uniref:DUF1828 domain-containing protein n=1 Tax=Alicyclobacillus mali (ex Roth et al. 2021) TaxID=1123961 RepID=A0ABS0F5E0_9BACL|nr:DUF1828 domain-containing protein [Alicyclobacillus mali (ex Roth et al. 2021)]MBF8378466.1 DUF1828 domain-containing protein [Alicyclobacillus mali (ex Roth et al. 2021)]